MPQQEPNFQGRMDLAWVLAQCDFRPRSLNFSEPQSLHLYNGHTHSSHFTGLSAQCLAFETLLRLRTPLGRKQFTQKKASLKGFGAIASVTASPG